jgi:hypothetical protein
VQKRAAEVRVEYEIHDIEKFLSAEQLAQYSFDLDISKWELNRTHWAVKDVNLPKELHPLGVVLPTWLRDVTKGIDIAKHNFDVGFSFPGEERVLVEKIAVELERRIGPNSYFYDNNYISQLARPSLDSLLQDIYQNRSRLIVVFISSNYQNKDWCGIEFRAIKEIMMARDHSKIMLIRTDDGVVDGIFKTDGYVDARRFTPSELAAFIHERVNLIPAKS